MHPDTHTALRALSHRRVNRRPRRLTLAIPDPVDDFFAHEDHGPDTGATSRLCTPAARRIVRVLLTLCLLTWLLLIAALFLV